MFSKAYFQKLFFVIKFVICLFRFNKYFSVKHRSCIIQIYITNTSRELRPLHSSGIYDNSHDFSSAIPYSRSAAAQTFTLAIIAVTMTTLKRMLQNLSIELYSQVQKTGLRYRGYQLF